MRQRLPALPGEGPGWIYPQAVRFGSLHSPELNNQLVPATEQKRVTQTLRYSVLKVAIGFKILFRRFNAGAAIKFGFMGSGEPQTLSPTAKALLNTLYCGGLSSLASQPTASVFNGSMGKR